MDEKGGLFSGLPAASGGLSLMEKLRGPRLSGGGV
jgi:hypothetical protein